MTNGDNPKGATLSRGTRAVNYAARVQAPRSPLPFTHPSRLRATHHLVRVSAGCANTALPQPPTKLRLRPPMKP